jgi:hypothetical protein
MCRPDLGDIDVSGAVHSAAVGKDEQEITGDSCAAACLAAAVEVVLLQNGFANEDGTAKVASED